METRAQGRRAKEALWPRPSPPGCPVLELFPGPFPATPSLRPSNLPNKLVLDLVSSFHKSDSLTEFSGQIPQVSTAHMLLDQPPDCRDRTGMVYTPRTLASLLRVLCFPRPDPYPYSTQAYSLPPGSHTRSDQAWTNFLGCQEPELSLSPLQPSQDSRLLPGWETRKAACQGLRLGPAGPGVAAGTGQDGKSLSFLERTPSCQPAPTRPAHLPLPSHQWQQQARHSGEAHIRPAGAPHSPIGALGTAVVAVVSKVAGV